MYSPRIKGRVFVLEALNSLATTYYFYYVYFFTESKFGFGRMQNLTLAAGLGLTYALASITGGRFAQRAGYFRALKLGIVVMITCLSIGARLNSLAGHLGVMFVSTLGMGMTWPSLQALVSEGEPRARLQKMLGIYNLVWASHQALAYLTGGAMIEAWGLRSMFIVPAVLHTTQLAFLLRVEQQAEIELANPATGQNPIVAAHEPGKIPASPVTPETFLRMAWLANPFAYLTINTVIAVSPSLARSLGLSTALAGYFCSIWMFTRAASFGLFWLWPGWHYRFRWLINAYAGMIASFVTILLSPSLVVLVAGQIAFGLCIGLIYYSSLFYSMDVGETKGEHGGFHEAAIGIGSFAGPAIGAAALFFFPAATAVSTFAVGGMLFLGLGGLLRLRYRKSA
jgi:MFS family permease